MGIMVFWDNDNKTIARQLFEGVWDLGEYYASRKAAYEIMSVETHAVALICDLRNSGAIPKDTNVPLWAVQGIPMIYKPSLAVFVGDQFFCTAFINFLKSLGQMDNEQHVIVPTLEEAYQVIAKRSVVA